MQVGSILTRHRTDFHSYAPARCRVPHDGFGANLPFLHKEMKIQQLALAFSRARLQKEASGTQISYPGNISARGRFPVDPHVIGSYRDTRCSPAGGAGCDLHRTHRLHPVPLEVFSADFLPPFKNRVAILPDRSAASQHQIMEGCGNWRTRTRAMRKGIADVPVAIEVEYPCAAEAHQGGS